MFRQCTSEAILPKIPTNHASFSRYSNIFPNFSSEVLRNLNRHLGPPLIRINFAITHVNYSPENFKAKITIRVCFALYIAESMRIAAQIGNYLFMNYIPQPGALHELLCHKKNSYDAAIFVRFIMSQCKSKFLKESIPIISVGFERHTAYLQISKTEMIKILFRADNRENLAQVDGSGL